MPFGQLVIGPPGSGKTTYCEAMRRHLTARGRDVAVVNLDPASDTPPHRCDVNISELVVVDDVVEAYNLGPNGSMIFCFEHLLANLDWLDEKLAPFRAKFVIFDCPGQVELFTHHDALRAVAEHLNKSLGYRLVALNLLDAHHCAEVSKYVSGLVVSLSAMLQLELPHVNVLSKVDLVEAAGPLALPLSFFTDAEGLDRLLHFTGESPAFTRKHAELTRRLCEIVEDTGLVSFIPMCAEDAETLDSVASAADKACGYAFGALKRNNHGMFSTAAGVTAWEYDRVEAVSDRYMGRHADVAVPGFQLGPDNLEPDEVEDGGEGSNGNDARLPRGELDGSDAHALAQYYGDELIGDKEADRAQLQTALPTCRR